LDFTLAYFEAPPAHFEREKSRKEGEGRGKKGWRWAREQGQETGTEDPRNVIKKKRKKKKRKKRAPIIPDS